MLDLGRSKVYEILAQEEDIETVQIGRSIRVNKASLERWLQTQRYPNWRVGSSTANRST
jgi:excisionase family DNA binding protein